MTTMQPQPLPTQPQKTHGGSLDFFNQEKKQDEIMAPTVTETPSVGGRRRKGSSKRRKQKGGRKSKKSRKNRKSRKSRKSRK